MEETTILMAPWILSLVRKNIIIGDNCMISFGSWIRNTDPHLVYDSSTYCRINPSKSVLIGDHVWIGQSCIILKGTVVGSGAILGAGSVVSGKKFLPITAGEEILHVFWNRISFGLRSVLIPGIRRLLKMPAPSIQKIGNIPYLKNRSSRRLCTESAAHWSLLDSVVKRIVL